MQLLNVRELAARLRISTRQVWKLQSAGRLPRALRIARATRWKEEDVNRWCQLNCPPLHEFEAAVAGEGGRR
ncbi:MAG: helix-turn-helix domain-containing protein [Phycisphaerales bacterium]|nr:helix-turn-helix domain-containing protein [Phycisphaerales bacterium]